METARKSLLDPTFVYRNAASTDVRLTFERVRREQALREGRPVKLVAAITGKPSAFESSTGLSLQKARSNLQRSMD